MKNRIIGWAVAGCLIGLAVAQIAPASAQGDDGSRYIPNDHRPLQIRTSHGIYPGKRRARGKSVHRHDTALAKKTALICPVTGDRIASVKNAVGKSTYGGKTFYFCCAGCKPRFDKNPAQITRNAAAGRYEKM